MAKLVTKEAFECDPDFCPRCGSILPLPGVSDVVSCILCDFKKDASEFEDIEVHSRKVFNIPKEKATALKDSEEPIGPMADRKCSNCGHEGMTYTTRQTRSADEGQTDSGNRVFLRISLPTCNHVEVCLSEHYRFINPLLIADPMNLSFAGCGFLGVYHLGVATCLTSHAPQFLKNVTAFAGASAGSLVAAVLATSAPLDKCSDYVIELTHEARRHPLGPFNPQFDLVGSLRKGLELYLPSNSHRIASGRLFISVTSLKDRKNAILSEFDSKEDLIQVLLASCYIPFYAGLSFPRFRGQKWVDGGLSDNLPRLPFGRTIRVSPFSGNGNDICPQDESRGFTDVTFHNMNVYVNRENLQRELQIFIPPKKDGIESLVQLGFNDTLRFLRKENLCNYSVKPLSPTLPMKHFHE
ncbi:unnamed protein product [Pocillopora meandrina]|uniref:DNA-directed RNA polymerase I subunit H n=1 Tax=Pocillopora meandrina TaxID=46732 RepID=A0AAU9XKH3_9CNID|nr:unnamed protein product [Pocillopora meandrina]